jgi:hypothetical protein
MQTGSSTFLLGGDEAKERDEKRGHQVLHLV